MSDQALRGQFVTETFNYNGGRQVTVYVPPEPPEIIIYAGDGQRNSLRGRGLEEKGILSTMIVGIHRLTDEMPRLHEYSPGFEPERFAAHEKFFVKDVRDWVESRLKPKLPPERTAVYGVSAGGELALALGLRHPDIYGAILCASPGAGYKPTDAVLPKHIPRTYFVVGNQEPFFARNAKKWADTLRESGAEVRLKTRIGPHGGEFWRTEFPLMVKWVIGNEQVN